jgi:hypothetical protein
VNKDTSELLKENVISIHKVLLEKPLFKNI